MIMFRPLIRYADFNGRASRGEYWLFAVLQGLWYTLLIGLAAVSMGSTGDTEQASAGVMIAIGVIIASVLALIVPNYAVLVRRLHDSGRGAIWLCLMLPSILSSVMTLGTILTAVSAVGMGASREAFVGTALAGLGAAGLLSVIGMVCQLVLFVLTLLPGAKGENAFGPDPRDPGQRYGGEGGSSLDEARLDALFAEAKRAGGIADAPYKPVFDFGPGPGAPAAAPALAPRAPVAWGGPAPSNGITPAPTFGRRGL
ncbi:DUF805 domain-containing protein [Brevundimonas sp.]|uniref:DUF805 domain-containing protein n=1 Tax=Brevundimonas sp. TaxID=1871086 RepID=UPI0026027437|nr:DUF805 domain-containing protein [Brevundimonas sp.]